MRRGDLLRRTSFRLAFGVTVFIVASLVLASGIGYSLMRQQLKTRQQARVTEIFSALQQTILAGDKQDLIEAITTRIAASPDHATIYLLRDKAGRVLAANITDVTLGPGWSIVPATQIGVPTDYPYRVFSGKAGDYSLTVGLTDADLDDLREIILSAFGWSAVFALIAALGAGTVLAAGVQRRLSLVDATLHRVAQGDLDARLAVTPRGDDLDQIAGAINTTLARLGSLVEAMRQVSTDIAHDLRTPLNRLRIHIEDAARKSAAGAAVDDDLAAAIAESETIDGIFAALLRIAQIEVGARRERFSPIDVADLLTGVAEVYAEVAEDAGMELTCQTAEPAWISGDKELLTQMFANLVENAIRHCPVGTKISYAVTHDATTVTAVIADTGPGIAEAERGNVLRRLYRLEKSRTTPGSGLGLSLVKAVADLHDAELHLADARPGLQVRLVFPRTTPAPTLP